MGARGCFPRDFILYYSQAAKLEVLHGNTTRYLGCESAALDIRTYTLAAATLLLPSIVEKRAKGVYCSAVQWCAHCAQFTRSACGFGLTSCTKHCVNIFTNLLARVRCEHIYVVSAASNQHTIPTKRKPRIRCAITTYIAGYIV